MNKDLKNHKCPACGNVMTERELEHTWDWAGPHCNECGCTGMEMFTEVMKDTPVVNAQGDMIYQLSKIEKSYKILVDKFKSFILWAF